MSLRQALLTAAMAGTMLVLAGCYGSTEPATDIGFDHATFHGQGTTNNGPADVYFEFWPTAHPTPVLHTPGRSHPGGVTGPVSQPNEFFGDFGLDPGTRYSFRMCGVDDAGPGAPVCAQTRTFETPRPDGDLAHGIFLTELGGIGREGSVDARNDAAGHASGTLELPRQNTTIFSGDVTCLLVHGNEAVVGALGTRDGRPAAGLLKVQDGLQSGDNRFAWVVTPGTTPPNCATATFGPLSSGVYSSFSVYDAP